MCSSIHHIALPKPLGTVVTSIMLLTATEVNAMRSLGLELKKMLCFPMSRSTPQCTRSKALCMARKSDMGSTVRAREPA
uniref:Putative secreted protein n=1 Tax=Ixodes ricinus TaxID=34613 RepID=A0A6B0UCR9_IXORI